MIVTTRIKIDLQHPSYPAVINAVQSDQNTRRVELSLYSGSVAWMVPSNVAVAVRYCKPDKTKGYYDTMPDGSAAFTVSENKVSVLLAPQILTVAGTVTAQVVLHQGPHNISTFSVQIRVEADPSAGSVTSEDYINWAQWLKSEMDAYLEQLKTSGEFVGGTFVGDVNLNGHALSGLREPVAQDDAATKEYVDKNAGSGAVSTVAGVAPDPDGNVLLTASDVKALPIGGGTMEGGINMNGQRVTGLNEPIQDDEAATKGFVVDAVNKAAPYNILGNPWFVKPANQRGKTTYNAAGYSIDRWRLSAASNVLTIKAGCINLANNHASSYYGMYQRIETQKTPAGGTDVTMAVMDKSGNIYVGYTTMPAYGGESRQFFNISGRLIASIYPAASDQKYARVFVLPAPGTNIDLVWAGLFPGVYTEDELRNFVPRDHAVELLECQRYYLGVEAKTMLYGYTRNGTEAYLVIVLPTPMAGTVSIDSDSLTIQAYINGTVVTFDSYEVVAGYDENTVMISLTGTSLSAGRAIVGYATTRFGLSAEL